MKFQFVSVVSIFAIALVVVTFSLNAQFYVAPNGNDSNSGRSPDHAFATLDAAKTAMRKNKVKITYVRAGIYFPPRHYIGFAGLMFGLVLESPDSGEIWSYYPPDGYNSAILDGRSTGPDSGLGGLVHIGCKNVTWNGIQIQNFVWNGIFIDHSSNITIINSIIHHGTFNMNGSGKNLKGAGGILATRTPNLIIANNVVYNIAYCGILVMSIIDGGMNNATIENNVVLNTMIGIQDGASIKDGGAIYLMDNFHSSKNIAVKNNFVRDYGTSSSWSKGLYFDDGASNVTATGNIITGTGEYAIQYHGGININVTGNIIDIGSSESQLIAIYQNSGIVWTAMTGNTFTNNIIIAANNNGGKGWWVSEGLDTLPVVKNNLYYNYTGASVKNSGTQGLKGDPNFIYENPLICGWLYNIDSKSPVFKKPVGFPPITGKWGPPGYEIPMSGTQPSCPLCK